MHFIFMPYGKRSEVELMLRDMEAQNHKLHMTNGKETKYTWIQGQVRLLPLGLYEYVFPKEDMDTVLNTLIEDKDRYQLGASKLAMLRKISRSKKIPPYKKTNKYLWIKDHVNVIPIGIREDTTIVGTAELDSGYTHEAI